MVRTVRIGMSLLLLVAAPAVGRAAPSDEAKDILDTAGVKGGLVAHLGCGNGKLTAALHAGDGYLVHGLDTDAADVAEARAHIHSRSLYGPVSVDTFDGRHLPYADNLVNLLVAEDLGDVPMSEAMRVLAPGGVALVGTRKTIKPRPEDIDEWTHFLYDASGNAVSKDRRVRPPKHLQWVTGPRWCRSHEFPSSFNAGVSAGGRIFYIFDEGPIGVYRKLPQQCRLIARDAANGVLLWKRPMKKWGYEFGTGLGDRWHIHHTLPRRLVAHGDKVYVTFSFHNSPVSVVDAATGDVLTEALEGTEGTDEMLYADGVLVVKITDQSPEATSLISRKDLHDSLAAVDVERGRLLWRKEKIQVAPYALALKDNRIVYHNLEEIVCLDAKTGHQQWRVANDAGRIPGAGSTLLVSEDVVLYHSFARDTRPGARRRTVARLTALSLEDGHLLWSGKGGIGWAGACTQPTDLFVAGGLVWCGQSREGRDLRTGEVKKTLELGRLISPGHHPRCLRSKATECFLIWPKRGAEFVDLNGSDHMRHNWLRAPCFTGFMPANGLLYVPPSQCFCYPGVKLSGFLALSGRTPEVQRPGPQDPAARLEQGPAYGKPGETEDAKPHRRKADSEMPGSADWPMYRRDPRRSGATEAAAPAELTKLWEVALRCEAAQPIVVGDRLFVTEKDAHRIRCLSAADGRPLWDFTAGGRIDSAPTIHDGLVLFGGTDGWVYCLRAADGELVWRFRAAPAERLVTSFGQLESAWPVHGSVLVEDGIVYCSAGRSSFLDGGIWLYALEPKTGRVLHRARLEGPWPDIATEGGGPFAMEGAKSDLFVSDGEYLYMERIKLDRDLHRVSTPAMSSLGDLDMGGRHLLATGGFLDDSGFDRLFWMYGKRWPGFYFAQQSPKSGQLVVFNRQTTVAVKYFYRRHGLSPGFVPAEEGYLLFADDNDNEPVLVGGDRKPATVEWLPPSAKGSGRYAISARAVGVEKGIGYTRAAPAKWQKLVPVRARAMVLAGDRLFVAGAADVVDENDPLAAFQRRTKAVLDVFSVADGALLNSRPLPSPPTFDGMSAAGGRLYVSTADRRLICLGQAEGATEK